jgi:hypothetical protein
MPRRERFTIHPLLVTDAQKRRREAAGKRAGCKKTLSKVAKRVGRETCVLTWETSILKIIASFPGKLTEDEVRKAMGEPEIPDYLEEADVSADSDDDGETSDKAADSDNDGETSDKADDDEAGSQNSGSEQ